MKLDRLIRILNLLLEGGQFTAPELAHRMEVSPKTILRDIDTLGQAGIPVITRQGVGGGISLDPDYRLDTRLLSSPERSRLASVLTALADLEGEGTANQLLGKLGNPGENILGIDLGQFDRDATGNKVRQLDQAARQRRLAQFTYFGQSGRASRTVEPYRLQFKWTAWYLLGFCRDHQNFRWFRLDRLWDIELLPSAFFPRDIPPEILDQDQFLVRDARPITVLFDPKAERDLVEDYGPNCYTVDPDGRLRLIWSFVSESYVMRWLLGYGPLAYVVEPEDIRIKHMEAAQKILDQYQ